LIIASRERAAQAERRFESLVDPANSFALALAPTPGGDPHIVWRTVDDGRPESYVHEPLASVRRQLAVSFFALLPIEDQL